MKELVEEHQVLVRQWGRLQQSMTDTIRSQQRAFAQMQAQEMRLRGQLIVARTQLYWGMSGVASMCEPTRPHPSMAPAPAPATYWPQAEAVLCRTACKGHAHPWRDDHGLCQRTGEACGSANLGEESEQVRRPG